MADRKENQNDGARQKGVELTGEALRTAVADELNEIALRSAARPMVCNLTADELLGYDEFGVPTK